MCLLSSALRGGGGDATVEGVVEREGADGHAGDARGGGGHQVGVPPDRGGGRDQRHVGHGGGEGEQRVAGEGFRLAGIENCGKIQPHFVSLTFEKFLPFYRDGKLSLFWPGRDRWGGAAAQVSGGDWCQALTSYSTSLL